MKLDQVIEMLQKLQSEAANTKNSNPSIGFWRIKNGETEGFVISPRYSFGVDFGMVTDSCGDVYLEIRPSK